MYSDRPIKIALYPMIFFQHFEFELLFNWFSMSLKTRLDYAFISIDIEYVLFYSIEKSLIFRLSVCKKKNATYLPTMKNLSWSTSNI